MEAIDVPNGNDEGETVLPCREGTEMGDREEVSDEKISVE